MKFYKCRRCRNRIRAVQNVLPAKRKPDTQTNYCNPLIPRSEQLGLKIKQVNKSILENNEVSCLYSVQYKQCKQDSIST